MKLKLFIVTLFFLGKTPAQTNTGGKILEILIEQQTSWNQGNLDGFMKYYWKNDSLSFISKNGIKKGWQSVYDGYQKSYTAKGEMGTLKFEILKIDILSSKDALVLGSWKVSNDKGTQQGYFTLWFKKIKRNWVIVQDHTS